ncbi:MAG: class I SAM-dependent methyltransferase [Actinomycetia bacterium]|nr:class I SAM-dependent methyltransferase [Actinomycetes bacterium]
MEASDWDERYRTAEYVWSAEPNLFLPPEVEGLPTGRAVDLACGEGRNAVWLAEQGWKATGVDFSQVAIDKARRLADDRGVSAEWEVADATRWDGPAGAFDLAIAFYLQLPADERRAAMAVAARSLSLGGTLLVVAHDSANLHSGTGGPQHAGVLYGPDDVLGDLAAAGLRHEVVRAETVQRHVDGADRPALDCLVRVNRTS